MTEKTARIQREPPVLQAVETEIDGSDLTYLIESSDEIPDEAMSDGRWVRTSTPLDVERCR